MSWNRNRRGVVVVAAGLAMLAGCGKQEAGGSATKAEEAQTVAPIRKTLTGELVMDAGAPELKEMKIEAVRNEPAPLDEVTVTARIQANPHSVGHALVPVPGRVLKVLVRLGDRVAKGQPLAAIDSPAVAEAEAAYAQADAAVRQAEIGYTKAEADLTRLTDLFEHQAVAQKEVLAAKTTMGLMKASEDQSRSAREQARRRLELLGLKAGEFHQQVVVTAPISGKVMEVSVVEGEFRNEINTPLVTITDLSRVWVTSEVPESQIRLFQVGGIAHLELIAYPNETFHARITRIADAVDSETRTVKVNAEIENPAGRFRPDMFGSMRYSAGEAAAPWIPETAVIRQNGVNLVFVERSAGRFAATPVELGKPLRGGYPVLKGVTAGERIVTQGPVYLKAAL